MFTSANGKEIRVYGDRDSTPLEVPENETSRTKQEFKKDADINQIVARFLGHGILPVTPNTVPTYQDQTGAVSFHESQTFVAQIHSEFENLPAELRDTFENDPAQLLAFMGDEANHAEAIEMGLLPAPPPAPKPDPALPDPPAPADPPAAPEPPSS